jgi:hypothetical protein
MLKYEKDALERRESERSDLVGDAGSMRECHIEDIVCLVGFNIDRLGHLDEPFFQEEWHSYGGPLVLHRAAVLAYDVTSRRIYEYALILYSQISEIRKDKKLLFPILLVGCQIDRTEREISLEEARS